jgi:6-phosphogluconate dehydrogenase
LKELKTLAEDAMEIGMIGLGKMGANMATRLINGGHRVVAFDRSADAIARAVSEGAVASESLEALARALKAPRAVWVMVPSGDPTEQTVQALGAALSKGDTVIDGGNSNYKDSVRRGELLKARGMHFVDCGTSGGIWGLEEGYSMMVGGDRDAVDRLRPVFETLAPGKELGWGHVGPTGAGHFVKMVHNGIEYGLMQAYAEGFEILHKKKEFGLDLAQVGHIWQDGSVVRSWLLDLTTKALEEHPGMADIAPWVADSGEGRWTLAEAIDLDVPAPVIALSLMARLRSRSEEAFSDRLLAAMRQQFGGHAVKTEA